MSDEPTWKSNGRVQVKIFSSGVREELENIVNEFLSKCPLKQIREVQYRVAGINNEANDYQSVMVVYEVPHA